MLVHQNRSTQQLYLHYLREPYGEVWEQTKHLFTDIIPFRNTFHLAAQQSPIAYISNILYNYGGIYINWNTIILGSFDVLDSLSCEQSTFQNNVFNSGCKKRRIIIGGLDGGNTLNLAASAPEENFWKTLISQQKTTTTT